MAYKDPKTGNLYPSKEWMLSNIANLPEVQKAYPGEDNKEPSNLSSVESGIKSAQTKISEIAEGIKSLSAEKLTETGDLNMPDPNVDQLDLSHATSRTDYWQKLYDEEKAESERKQKEYDEKMAEYEKKQTKLWNQLTSKDTLEEKRTSLWEELGMQPSEYFAERQADIASMQALLTSYDDKVAQRDAAIAQIEGRAGIGMEFLTGESKRINNAYNVELNRMSANINTQAAVMEARQNNFTEARSFINEAVDAYTYDLQLAYEQYDMFKEENREVLDDLRQDYKDALDASQNAAYQALVSTEEEKNNVMNLMLQYPSSGISINDTIQEATEKARSWQATQPAGLGELRTVSGVGVVSINPDGSYNVIVPEPADKSAPTTKEVGGVLYQWNPETQNWDKAPGVVPGEQISASEQRQVNKEFAQDVEDETGAFYVGLRQIDTAGGKRPMMEDLADLAVADGVDYQGFKDALESYKGIKIYPDGEVWTTKWFNQRVGNLNDESVKAKFTSTSGSVSSGASDEDVANILFSE